MDSHNLTYHNLVCSGNGRNCCAKITQLVEALFGNNICVEALNEILQCPRDIFKDTNNEGLVFFPRGRGKDLGNMCYIEYALAKAQSTGPAIVPSRRTLALGFNKFVRDWFH